MESFNSNEEMQKEDLKEFLTIKSKKKNKLHRQLLSLTQTVKLAEAKLKTLEGVPSHVKRMEQGYKVIRDRRTSQLLANAKRTEARRSTYCIRYTREIDNLRHAAPCLLCGGYRCLACVTQGCMCKDLGYGPLTSNGAPPVYCEDQDEMDENP